MTAPREPPMPRAWSEKRILVAWTTAGLVLGVLLSIGLVWKYVDRYRWRDDGSLNTDAFSSRPRLRESPDVANIDHVDPPGRRRLSRSQKVWIGCQESFPIWFVSGLLGFGAGMIHLRIRRHLRERAKDPERQNYDDSIKWNCPPPVT
jgi:hypothetical protein